MFGCGKFARSLLEASLIDELRFWVHPAVSGCRRASVSGAGAAPAGAHRVRGVRFGRDAPSLRTEPLTASQSYAHARVTGVARVGCAGGDLRRRARSWLARLRCSSCLGRPDPSVAATGTGVDPRCRLRDGQPLRPHRGGGLPRSWHRLLGTDGRGGEKEGASGSRSAPFEVDDAQAPAVEVASYDVVIGRHILWALPDPSSALRRWVAVLRKPGILVLVEGRWSTGAGLTAAECERLVRPHREELTITRLDDPALWGRPITDERYLLVSRA